MQNTTTHSHRQTKYNKVTTNLFPFKKVMRVLLVHYRRKEFMQSVIRAKHSLSISNNLESKINLVIYL